MTGKHGVFFSSFFRPARASSSVPLTSSRRFGNSRGYTILEIIIVLFLVSLLSSLGYMAFTSVVSRARDEDAAAQIQSVYSSEQRFAQAYGTYTSWPADLSGFPSDLTVVDTASTAPRMISVALGSKGSLGFATVSETGNCVVLTIPSTQSTSLVSSTTTPTSTICEGAAGLPVDEAPVTPVSARW